MDERTFYLNKTVRKNPDWKAWGKAASVEIALSGFRATGIFPLDPAVIPDHFCAIADVNAALPSSTPEGIAPVAEKEIRHRQSSVPGPLGISINTDNAVEETPEKFLAEISPVPVLQKRRKKQFAEF